MAKIRTGDRVKVLAGNYKNKVSKVISYKGKDMFVVEGVNVRKKAVKRQNPEDTGFMEIFAPIHVSNIAVVVEKDDKDIVVKLKYRIVNGKKELYYKDGDDIVVHRVVSSCKSK
ncbi:MAG: 50S ribosomal protein L24 [Chlamydiia bacterium]|nr:50S ribosomal protein L24 [Chlamydiia bacterium]